MDANNQHKQQVGVFGLPINQVGCPDNNYAAVEKPVSQIKISTKTIIGVSNVECDIHSIYKHMVVREMNEQDRELVAKLIPQKKQRGRRKKETPETTAENERLRRLLVNPSKGDVVGLYYQDQQRGLPQFLKPVNKSFRNALNIIMMATDTKKVNFKLSKNGKIQMTGCKTDEDVHQCISILFSKLVGECFGDLKLLDPSAVSVHYYTVMTNIDFNMGFKINRQKLNILINESTDFNSLLETSFGYTGVNIKIPMRLDEDMLIDKLTLDVSGGITAQTQKDWKRSEVPFQEFLKGMDRDFRLQETEKKRYNTFLVFHSGNVIMSGMRLDKMMDLQQQFYRLLQYRRTDIEEMLVPHFQIQMQKQQII